jgi:small GTP-binding protein
MNKEQELIRCKTIIVGDSGVGKTSIIGRYINKFNVNEKSTIGASFTNKVEKINDKELIFEIWDTAGQERFRSINNIFYQDSYICIMVYDITNRNSFNSLKDYWYNAVKEYGPQGIIFHVAGNKIDLFEEEEVDRNDVKEYCESIDCEYSFISATENTFIDELFKKIGEKFLNSDIYKNLEQNKKNNKSQIFAIEDDEEDKKNSKNKNKKKKCC